MPRHTWPSRSNLPRRAIGRRYPPHSRIDDRAALVWSGVYAGGAAYGIAAAALPAIWCSPTMPDRADILFSFRSDGLDPFGLMGRTWSADGAVGFGVHGGWHANEMSWVGILAGPLIERRFPLASSLRHLPHCADSARPSGLSRRATMTGRALAEVFIDDGQDVPRTLKRYARPAAEGEDCGVGPNLRPDYVQER
ncbi:hypothetical protein ABIB00_007693 [Bradyrhizobium sp. LB14.3]